MHLFLSTLTVKTFTFILFEENDYLMILAVLGLIDIIAGVSIIFPSTSPFLLYFAIFCLIKGVISIPSLLEGEIFIFILGLIDIAAFFSLTLAYLNFSFLKIVGLLMILKGIYSFITGIKF